MSKNKRRTIIPDTAPVPTIEEQPETEFQEEELPEEAGSDQETPDSQASGRTFSFLQTLSKIPVEKPRRVCGFLCLFASLFLFVSILSHFFFWWIDFDVVQQMQTGNLWSGSDYQVRNFGGRLGAYVAFALVNKGFGIAAFIIPTLLFMAGMQILKLRKFHWLKIFFQSVFGLLWISVLFGSLFKGGSNYVIGGSAGLYASRYLNGLLGTAGLVFLLVFAFLSYLIVSHNLGKLKIPKRKTDEFPHPYGTDEAGQESLPVVPPMVSCPKEREEDPLAGMTLSSRIRLQEKPTIPDIPSVQMQPSAEETDEDPFEPVLINRPPQAVLLAQDQPQRIILTLDEEETTEEEPTFPHAGIAAPTPTPDYALQNPDSENISPENTPESNPRAEETEYTEELLDEMKIIDTRTVSENKIENGSPLVRPEHFGIETPYDPRLDLSDYRFPTLDLLEDFGDQSQKIQDMNEELLENKKKIVDTLQNYGIDISKISATIGPTVTLYEIVPAPGIRISKIKNLEDDIALSLSALGIRIIAPIPGKGTIGIEVPNSKKQIVPMRDMLTCDKFRKQEFALPIALGKTISNEEFVTDLAKMPHVLVAGATGQGKSVGLNAIIASLLYSKHPAELKFVMVDPKKVELSLFNKIERHYLAKLPDSEEAIITDTRKVVRTLNSLCIEMDNRYDLLKDAAAKNIKEYNKKFISRRLNPEEGHRYLPYIVLIIDEFADLIMTAGKEIEQPIARLAQLARAIGIHLVIATQRPSVNIITGLIKANFPARIAFKVMQKNDSRTILDANGADQLIGRGDMLISMGEGLTRLQCAFIDTPEIERITEFIGTQRGYPSAYLLPECPDENGNENGKAEWGSEEWDPLFREAAELVVSTQQGSTSMLQRKFKLGYNRAGRIMDQLESAGIVGAFDGKKTREVKIKDPVALEQIFNTLSI